MSNNKDRKDFNKLNINRDIKEEFMRIAKDIEDTHPTKSKSTKKPAARGRPKGAKNKVKKPIKQAKGFPAHEAQHQKPKADKIPQGAEAEKHVETRRDKIIHELQCARWKLPVIQSRSEVSSKGEINAHDIMGVLRERPPYGMTVDYIVPEPVAMLFATDYVIVPEYAFDRFKGSRLIAFRLTHKSHVDTKDPDPIWLKVNIAELSTK
jgi:DNA-directed RNA polymerase subunit H (RpoH/RPB5)